jgi:hypothetical protein
VSWGFKALEAITLPSVTAFVTLDPIHPKGIRPTELRDYYEAAADLALPSSVPQDVRDYFDAVRMLWVHGWFYYPFYTLATVHSGLCVEMALRERFRLEGLTFSQRGGALKKMLEEAVHRRWLVPDGFATLRRRKESENFWAEVEADIDGEKGPPVLAANEQALRLEAGMRRLLDGIRQFRNIRAHPRGLSLRLPGMTYTELQFVTDLIAQLFAPAL